MESGCIRYLHTRLLFIVDNILADPGKRPGDRAPIIFRPNSRPEGPKKCVLETPPALILSFIYKGSGRFIFRKKVNMRLQLFELNKYMGTLNMHALFLILQCDLPIFIPNFDWYI